MAPKVDVFVTSYLSSPAIRSRHDRVKRHLASARVQFTTHDVAASEEAKSFWLRKEKSKNRELPCILVDGEWVGTVEQLDEAVEFDELRQFLRLDTPSQPPSSSSATATKSPTLDDFSSLSLTPAELAELQAELESGPSAGFEGTSDGASTFVPTAPLVFKPRTKEEKVKVVKALGDRGPLAEDQVDDLDGIELTEAEAEELARELGLETNDIRPPTTAPVPGAPSTTSTSLTSSQLDMAKETAPVKNPQPPTGLAATSVGGQGGASLSAPISQIEKLDLSPSEKAELVEVKEQTGGKIDVEPVTAFEERLREEVKKDVARGGKEEKEEKEGKSTKEELEDLKVHLREEEYLDDYSRPVPTFDDSAAMAVKEGIL